MLGATEVYRASVGHARNAVGKLAEHVVDRMELRKGWEIIARNITVYARGIRGQLDRIYGKNGLMKAVEIKANGSPTSKGQAAALNEGPKGTVLAGNNAKRAGFKIGETMESQNIETISLKKIKIYRK